MEVIQSDKTIEILQAATGNRLEVSQEASIAHLSVSPGDLVRVMQALRDHIGMNYLANLTAVDLGEEFEIVYHLFAIPDNQQKIVLKTRVSRNEAEVPSVFSIYPTADWQEREVYDLMGIRFSQHPNLVRVLLPDDFEGHPLRKDFKKGG